MGIIRGANAHLVVGPDEEEDASAEGLMNIMNTQYLAALATDQSKKGLELSKVTTQKMSLASMTKSQ